MILLAIFFNDSTAQTFPEVRFLMAQLLVAHTQLHNAPIYQAWYIYSLGEWHCRHSYGFSLQIPWKDFNLQWIVSAHNNVGDS